MSFKDMIGGIVINGTKKKLGGKSWCKVCEKNAAIRVKQLATKSLRESVLVEVSSRVLSCAELGLWC